MRILVVGVGVMGSLQARAVQTLPGATLCAVMDLDSQVAESAGAEFGVPAFTDLPRALAESVAEAVIIATPDPFHREPAEAVIQAGLPLLVEKPLATTVDDAEAMVGLAAERGVRLMTGHVTRFYPRYIQAVAAVQSGAVGKPLMVTTSTWGPRSLGARVAATTTPLWHFGIHDIDLIQWLTGGVLQDIDGAQLVESASGASAFAATGTLSTGAGFHMATGWTLPDSAAPRWDLKVHCESGLVQATWSGDGVTLYTADAAQELDCLAWPTLYGQVDGALRRELEHFVTAVRDNTPFLVSPDDALSAVRSAHRLEKATTVRHM